MTVSRCSRHRLLAGPTQPSGATLLSGSFLLSDAQLSSGNTTWSKLFLSLKALSVTYPCRFPGILKNQANIQPPLVFKDLFHLIWLVFWCCPLDPPCCSQTDLKLFFMLHATSLCMLIFLGISFSAKYNPFS